MSSIFCCSSPSPYRPAHLSHEAKFDPFIAWAKRSESSPSADSASFFQNPDNPPPYAVQFVRQVNFGAIEAKRYFIPRPKANGGRVEFVEITEQDLIAGNFQKLNSYKNFKCTMHNKFFEVNLYQKDPINRHHWRLNIARPASDIDL
ncbi:hypothetical protein N7491_000947 [Penicillium cf. griseofulvum]|uniref:Uncharacterized protein n=1 Tax=Penicillium cf. griseofulvum TaxID=2972120 RepID=A0A9W9M8C5_9EURO|nr:hypothetical protein N7472_006082 [Penicillium cf. griseofulvum]KAJ5444865.1 hypothetical protein N7491_000947 [Penicillium cf. griseofulvum]KAJ5446580.1 hypothetical protein N7445_001401 [Penicillium cf. griseofulvum]